MKQLTLLAVSGALILIASFATQRDGLGNVFGKLKAGKEVRLAYFGGSITAQNG